MARNQQKDRRFEVHVGARVLGSAAATNAPAAIHRVLDALSIDVGGARWNGRGLAVLGLGVVRARDVTPIVPSAKLPSSDEMRTLLKERGHDDANLIDEAAVEARYRANVLGEFIPHRSDWRETGGSTRRALPATAASRASHRHRWDLQGRQPNGAVRTCSACGERQVKRQRVDGHHYVERWISLPPSADALPGASTDRPQQAAGATATEGDTVPNPDPKVKVTTRRSSAAEAASTKAEPAAAAVAIPAKDAPADVEPASPASAPATGAAGSPDTSKVFMGLYEALLDEAKKTAGVERVEKPGYVRLVVAGKTVAYVYKPGRKAVKVAVSKPERGVTNDVLMTSNADVKKALALVEKRAAVLASPPVEVAATA